MHRYWRFKRMHVNKTHLWFCLTGWVVQISWSLQVAWEKALILGGELLTIEGRKESVTPEKVGMVVLFLISTFFCSGCILREEYFLPCCGAVLVFQQKAQAAWQCTDKIILSCASWNVAHQTGLCWVVKEPVSFRCYWDRTHCFHRPWELCP